MENLFDLYVCIAEKFSAGGKLKKWQENLLRVLCVLVFAAMLVLIPFGICLTADGKDAAVPGITMLAVGASVLIVHIALILCLAKKRETEEKREIEEDAAETFADGAPEPLVRMIEETESDAENFKHFCQQNSRESKE